MDVVTQGELAVSQEARDAAADYLDCAFQEQGLTHKVQIGEAFPCLSEAFQRAIDAAEARQRELLKAVLVTIKATNAHLPPGGISERECINRILGAVANAEVAAAIREGTNHDG